MHRITCAFDERNPASGRVMERAGMEFESKAKEAIFSNAGVGDRRTYVAFDDTWRMPLESWHRIDGSGSNGPGLSPDMYGPPSTVHPV